MKDRKTIKFVLIAMTVVAVIGLAACSSSKPQQTEEPAPAEEPEVIVEEPEEASEDAIEAFREAEEAEGRIVFTGEIATYNYEATVELQGFPDYNAEWTDKTQVYRIIVLDEPQEVTFQSVDGPYTSTVEMFSADDAGIPEDLDGHTIVFSVDPAATWWKSDTSIPLGAPDLRDVHVMQ
jgi:hypothetical protein